MLRIGRAPHQRLDLIIEAGPLQLRPPMAADFDTWAALRTESRGFLQPWEPLWPTDDLTPGAYRRRLRRYAEEIERDEGYPWFLFLRSDSRLIGGISLSHVRRGAASAATLGYWIGARYAGQGYMGRAVRAVLAQAYGHLRLLRIEAACLPDNEASIRLLERVGFRLEGLARSYLLINGAWRDHRLYARLRDDGPTA